MKRGERPIIVCGTARSGTTALSIMLNQHEEIGLAREVPMSRLPSLAALLSETATYHRSAWTTERRADVVRALWYFIGRPVPRHKRDLRRWGMKTPWSELDAELWNPLVEPLWIYVLRRGDRVFRSHIRLGWTDEEDPEPLIDRYKQSIRRGEALQAQGTAHICQMDLAGDRDSRGRLARDLFDFLEEEIDPGVQSFVESWPTKHPATHPAGENDTAQLPGRWQALLEADGEYQEMMQTHGY